MRNVLRVCGYLMMAAMPLYGASSPCRNFDFVPYALPESTGGAAPGGFIKIVAIFGGVTKTFELEFLLEVERVTIYDPNHPAIVAKPSDKSLADCSSINARSNGRPCSFDRTRSSGSYWRTRATRDSSRSSTRSACCRTAGR